MRSKLLLGTLLIMCIIHKSVALPLSYYNKTSNGGYTCCVTPTASCISGLIGSCIDCPLVRHLLRLLPVLQESQVLLKIVLSAITVSVLVVLQV